MAAIVVAYCAQCEMMVSSTSSVCHRCGLEIGVSKALRDCEFEARLRGMNPWMILRERAIRAAHLARGVDVDQAR